MPEDHAIESPEPWITKETMKVTVWCPEHVGPVVVEDIHAYLLGLHQRVCPELVDLNGTD